MILKDIARISTKTGQLKKKYFLMVKVAISDQIELSFKKFHISVKELRSNSYFRKINMANNFFNTQKCIIFVGYGYTNSEI